jgi:ADP-ribose pyrophosphatase YjhB (NUDIX family)
MPHIHEKIDFTVEAFIVYRDKVLLRMHDKHKLWLGVGGHVELDEHPVQAAIREAKEEVGLDIELVGEVEQLLDDGKNNFENLLVPAFMNIHDVSSTHRHIGLIYFARAYSDDVRPTGDDVSNEWRWLTREELLENKLGVLESIRHYALKALEALS